MGPEANEQLSAMLNELAAQVMLLEPGDLMAYGDVLSNLESLLEAMDEPTAHGPLGTLVGGLKSHLEGMILGSVSDQAKGLETLSEGLSLCQAIMRGDAAQAEVERFLADHGLGPQEPASPEAQQPEAPAQPQEPAPETAQEEGGEIISEEDMELLAGFVSEAMEHLESIEVNALVLEDNPEDPETLNAIFRPFHTIKGVSGFLNLSDINHLAHSLENLLDLARGGKLTIDSEAIDVILTGVDTLRQMISEAQAAANERRPRRAFDTSELEARINAILTQAEQAAAQVPKLGEVLVEKGVVRPEEVEQALKTQKEEKADRKLGELLVHQGAAEPLEVAEAVRTQRAMSSAGKIQEVKIDTAKLDNLLDMVGELVIAQSMVQANPHVQAIADRKLHADLAQLQRITTELQKTTMSMRMVPIKQTFQKMIRVVRDTARKQGKKVRLELRGETTEIDRNMVEKFYDPLVHMVRNSVDHGIEPPEERRRLGKPEEGVVILSAYHKGGNVCIEITDDGRGLSREKIVAKAIERGLITDDEGMSNEEVFHLIMQPGFSTAEKITDISGRGVGMDVVQRTIDELRGKIEITSEEGKGTTFTISLPLTLAIIDGMVVMVGSERFILPTISVVESLRPTREDYTTVQGKGEMLMIRGSLIPLLRLHEIMGIEPACREPWEGLVVVVEHHGVRRCLLVDRLVGRQEVVIKSLGECLKDVKVVAGGAIMGDGRVGLILDVEGVFRTQEARKNAF